MKHFNPTRKRGLAGLLSFAVVMLAITASLTACGKKGGNSAPVTGPGIVGPNGVPCVNCVAGSQFLFSALGGVYSGGGTGLRMELGLEFFSQGSSGFVGGVQNPYAEYSGPTFAQGVLRVFSNEYAALCNIPVGQYTVRPLAGAPATLYYDVVHDLVLEALGPVRMEIRIPRGILVDRTSAQVGTDGRRYPFRIQNQMMVTPQGTNCFGGNIYFLE